MIIIHDTAIATLAGSLAAFKPDLLPRERAYLRAFGDVNVGVHFLVDRDGTIYSLLPLDVIGRHAIGLNHVSIGIENVGKNEAALTHKQLESDVALVDDLVRRFPSLHYLIGHHEYVDRSLPHYRLYKELVSGYRPTKKTDPGPDFMKRLRAALEKKGLVLEN
ncbi:MAG: N-acetylmuramoyl-L-alanine amidase [Elusimicrobia bacterium]|nr:N-acetylmuramoyl-L-alanine amidase [Elusimicrobiota bacterium]